MLLYFDRNTFYDLFTRAFNGPSRGYKYIITYTVSHIINIMLPIIRSPTPGIDVDMVHLVRA